MSFSGRSQRLCPRGSERHLRLGANCRTGKPDQRPSTRRSMSSIESLFAHVPDQADRGSAGYRWHRCGQDSPRCKADSGGWNHQAGRRPILAADAKVSASTLVMNPDAGPVSGDGARLQQIIWNLLNNATKFTPKGGRISVLLERVNSHIEITVSDTGEGIAPDFCRAFSTTSARRTPRASGPTAASDWGYPSSKAWWRHMAARSTKSRGPGQGAAFIVALPLRALHVSSEPREHPRHSVGYAGDLAPKGGAGPC